MITISEISAIGKLQKTHALKGELNLLLDIDEVYLTAGNPAIIEIDGIFIPFYADSVRPKGSCSFLVKFDGIDTEEKAKALINKTVYALRSMLKQYIEDNYEESIALYDELVGWTVVDDRLGVIGIITNIDTNTINELLIVEDKNGNTVFIPFADDFIIEVNDAAQRIRMRLPDGIVDLN